MIALPCCRKLFKKSGSTLF